MLNLHNKFFSKIFPLTAKGLGTPHYWLGFCALFLCFFLSFLLTFFLSFFLSLFLCWLQALLLRLDSNYVLYLCFFVFYLCLSSVVFNFWTLSGTQIFLNRYCACSFCLALGASDLDLLISFPGFNSDFLFVLFLLLLYLSLSVSASVSLLSEFGPSLRPFLANTVKEPFIVTVTKPESESLLHLQLLTTPIC